MKRILSVLTLTLLVICLAGCKKSEPASSVESITFDKETYSCDEGGTLKMSRYLTITPESVAETVTVTWSVDKSDCAEISKSGLFTALKAGNVKVTATADGKSATCIVKISEIQITAFSLQKTADCTKNQPCKITLTCTPKEASPQHINLSFAAGESSKISYYFEGNDLYVKASEAGSYTLKASYGSMAEQSCKITCTIKRITSVTLTPTECGLEVGESKQLKLTVTPSDATYAGEIAWSTDSKNIATVDNNGLVTAVGKGTATITVKVGKASEGESVHTATCKVTVLDALATITDQCGNVIKVVTIGTQTWMAENMRCNTYASQSEAYSSIKTVPEDGAWLDKPSFIDATKKVNWQSTEMPENLSDEQVAKLGYLYTWTAVVGVQKGSDAKKDLGKRQGICPNGWHVPSEAEFTTLKNKIGTYAGYKLKSTSGWNKVGAGSGSGSDTYRFNLLPSGQGDSRVHKLGKQAEIWTSTVASSSSESAAYAYVAYDGDNILNANTYKMGGKAVRCIKN